MPENFHITEYYSVSCRAFDGGGADFRLGAARRGFFTEGRTVRGNICSVENGQKVHIKYRVGEKCFHWKKTGGGVTLQEAFSVSGGLYRFVEHCTDGRLLSAASYDAGLRWLQTAYYDGDPEHPLVLLKRGEEGILCRRYAAAGGYAEIPLLPAPWEPGAAAQSWVNAQAGEPAVTAVTDAGLLCFCPEEERALRLELREKLQADPSLLLPGWEEREGGTLDFRVVPNDGSAAAGNPSETPGKTPQSPGRGRSFPQKESDYAADHEIFSAGTARKPAKYAVAAKGLSGPVKGAFAGGNPTAPEAGLIPAKRIVVSSMESYLYFGRVLDGLRQGYGRTQLRGGCTAYEGGYRDDLRDGFGVYYYRSGKICYVGGWKRNLRNGLGVAFGAKDGSIFVGSWKDGCATGAGSEFDMDGNLTYTGGWKDGRREGYGAEYNGGRIVRSGVWKDDVFSGK